MRWALAHPANRGRRAWVVGRWLLHQGRKRMLARVPARVQVGPAALVGPPWHPVICLARYVRGGLADLDAFLVYESVLRPGDVFVDVGANIGLHAVVAASFLGPGGRVVACEPDPASRTWLERNLGAVAASWVLETRPVADRVRTLGWRGTGATLWHLEAPAAAHQVVEATTLDALVDALGLDATRTVVKVDVEGWGSAVLGSAVLMGARRALREGIRAVWLEANGLHERCDVPWEDAVRTCREAGMRFWVLDLGARRLREVSEPGPRSPTDHYLIAGPEVARRVAAMVPEWPAAVGRWLGGAAVR